ncbi:lipopolysaccharide biosynthesis protein [Bacillus timonensis]|uniref:lipopolysaccharide biosynthesis protein n=1 Tax=Bacillus timonensis TaxID=1033734 RepID=UPI000287A2FA|nr:oligosaccharide flippase family protein [Bacillus timonensis]
MKDLKKFIKSSGIYMLGNVATKAISFLLLPLYTNYLHPSDYGAFDLYIAYITFVSSILFLDIWGVILRFFFDYKEDDGKKQPIVVGMTIFTISTMLYSVTVFVLGPLLDIPFIFLLFLYGFFTNLNQVVGFTARAKGKDYIFVFGGLLSAIVNLLLSILFIAVFKFGYEYLYVSYIVGTIINIILVGTNIHFFKELKLKYFNKKLFKEMLIFALPLSLNSAAYWFLSSYNKIVISNKLSVVDNGLYAVAIKFGTIVQLFTQGFQMAWQELTFSKARKSKLEMDKFYTIAVNEYIKFLSLGTIILLPVIKLIFPLFIDSSYNNAISIIPFALIATLFSVISSFLASIISTIKKNKFIFTTTMFGSVVNVILINILISPIGVQAASVSLAIAYLVIVTRRFMLISRYLVIKVDYFMLLYITIFFSITCYSYFFLNNIMNAILFLILFCVPIFIYKDRIVSLIRKLSSKRNNN